MTAPPVRPLDFRPGEAGFNVQAPRSRVTVLAGSAWAVALIVAAILLLCAFVRLTHHQARVLGLRPTLHQSWVQPFADQETGRLKLYIGDRQS